MKALKDVVGMIDDELEAIAQNGKFRSREEIASVGQMVKAMKDAYCIFDMDDEDEEEYGAPRRSYREGERSYSRVYRAGRRRDSRGRYMDDGFEHKLREAMNDAPDEQTRASIRKMLENMGA